MDRQLFRRACLDDFVGDLHASHNDRAVLGRAGAEDGTGAVLQIVGQSQRQLR